MCKDIFKSRITDMSPKVGRCVRKGLPHKYKFSIDLAKISF